MQGPMSVVAVLRRLNLDRETVLVIRNGTLVPGDERLGADDVIEILSINLLGDVLSQRFNSREAIG